MKILALDTALNACSAALTVDGHVRAHRHEKRRRGHAERLMPMIAEVMAEAGMRYADLDMIAVTVGPGTFTGLRIGLAAARGLSLAAGKPLLGVTTLEALAAAIPPEKAAGRHIIAAADARRGEVYFQRFRAPEGDIMAAPLDPPAALPISEAVKILAGETAVMTGSGGPLLAAAEGFNATGITLLDKDADPDARIIAALAARREVPRPGDAPPAPLYLRAPDARLPGGIAITPKQM